MAGSWQDIIAIARKSGAGIRVTSTVRFEPGSHHHVPGHAVDFGGYNQISLAEYFMQYSPYLLELIHNQGKGFYVKNGKVVGPYANTGDDSNAHRNHIHVAMTVENARLVLSGKAGATAPSSPDSGGGGLNPLAPITDTIHSGAALFSLLSDPYTWKRVALGLIGAILTLIGVALLVPIPGLGIVRKLV